jgi:pyruvate/2-oxoglutarate dehydrogenase complex dihydrolipoamide dehydrogenase (E3) component
MPDQLEAPGIILPADTHNRRLTSNVHPTDWKNPTPRGRYNLVVIGGGTAGLVSAAGAAGLGAKVALIERHLLGGDCLNVGCVPSKALIRAGRAAAQVARAGQFGVRVPEGTKVDFSAVMERMRRLRADISPHDSAQRFSDLGIDVFLGSASFTGHETLQVGEHDLRFKRAVIATGARAFGPPIEGLDDAGYLTNETVFSLTELPQRLTVIGSGPIGCELAQAFARLGATVDLLDSAPHILPREDPDASQFVQQALLDDGVRIHLNAKIVRVARAEGGKMIEVKQPQGDRQIVADEILVGAGRVPNVEGLGLEAAGIEFDVRAGVHVNDRLQTTNRRVFAAGDVCSRFKFTHAADAMARIVIQNALFMGRAKASALTIPWCTYTDPEVAHVGLYPRDADERSIAIDTYKVPLSSVDRAILDGETDGFAKIHVRKGTDQIVGATVVAAHAGEIIAELSLAMTARLGMKTLAKTIHAYPTQAEVVKKAGDAYSRSRFTPCVAAIFRKWLAWTR